MNDPRTTPAVLDRIARDLPDHAALISTDRELTYAQLRDEVRRAAAALTREHLANFKAPRSVTFVDDLPRDPGGMVVKPQLREWA